MKRETGDESNKRYLAFLAIFKYKIQNTERERGEAHLGPSHLGLAKPEPDIESRRTRSKDELGGD